MPTIQPVPPLPVTSTIPGPVIFNDFSLDGDAFFPVVEVADEFPLAPAGADLRFVVTGQILHLALILQTLIIEDNYTHAVGLFQQRVEGNLLLQQVGVNF